ncbi:MAG: aldo/keto reductase [Gloeocapsa sp. DLM2.Bin57]|nr:MAG: aldo/keto reductase [Gloeocapsa sp. DLM2.Bin57]
MELIKLGKTDLEVTIIGIGTWAWGDKLFWNYGKQYGASQVQEAFNASIEAGITFFDTAEVYGLGESEKFLGNFSKQTTQAIDIATKYAPLPWRFSPQAVTDAINASLSRLQLDTVTLYQIHWPFNFIMNQETLLNTLADAVQAGKIKSVGVSNYSAEQMEQAYNILSKRDIPLAVNQVQYSLLYRQIESKGIKQKADELGVTILAYSPLAQGLLTGKYTAENKPDGARKLDSRFNNQGLTKIKPLLDVLFNLAAKYQKTPGQIALNWLICQGNVIPIPGAKNAQQAKENAGAAMWRLSSEDINELERVSRQSCS